MSHARRLSSERLYAGHVLSLDIDEVEEPSGVRARREVVRHHGSVGVLPVHADGRMTLIRQFRYAVDEEIWELPAGRIDPGETPEQAAARELEEETGLRPGRLERVSLFHTTPGFCDERVYLFRAFDLTQGPPRPDGDERIDSVQLDIHQVRDLLGRGEVRDAKTLVALLLEDARRRAGG